MNPSRRRLTLTVLMIAAPTLAHAHGGQLLFLFLYFPHIVVAVALLLALQRWRAAMVSKAVTAGAVLIASGALFAVNYAIQYGAIRFPFGNGAYLLLVLAQIVVPVAVGFACVRLARRRPGPQNG